MTKKPKVIENDKPAKKKARYSLKDVHRSINLERRGQSNGKTKSTKENSITEEKISTPDEYKTFLERMEQTRKEKEYETKLKENKEQLRREHEASNERMTRQRLDRLAHEMLEKSR